MSAESPFAAAARESITIPDNLPGGEIRTELLSLGPIGIGVRWRVGRPDADGREPTVELMISPHRLETAGMDRGMFELDDGTFSDHRYLSEYNAELVFERLVRIRDDGFELSTMAGIADRVKIGVLRQEHESAKYGEYFEFAQRALDELSRRRKDPDVAAFFSADVDAISTAEWRRINDKHQEMEK